MAETSPPVPDPANTGPQPHPLEQPVADLNDKLDAANSLLYGIYTQFGGGRQSGGSLPPIDTTELGAVKAASLVNADGAERKLDILAERGAAARYSAAHPTPKTRRPVPTGPVTAFVKSRLKQTGDAGRYAHAKLATVKAERSQKVHEMYRERPLMRRVAYRVGDVACWGLVAYGAVKGVDFLHPGN